MSIPFDQKLTKLRILERRARAEYDRENAEYQAALKRFEDEHRPKVHEAHERMVRVFSAYMNRAEQLGYCGMCEKTRPGECQCVWLASSTASEDAGRLDGTLDGNTR